MNSSFTTWARLLGVTAMLLPAALKADVAIYESTTGLLSNFYGSNAVPFVPDGTPNRPTGSWIGNTITFDPTLYGEGNNFLTSVDLATYQAEGDTQTFTVELFSGSDPNTGTFLGSSSASVGHSQPEATFLFNLYVPQTVTFVVTADPPGACGDTLPCSALDGIANATGAPQVGSAPNSLWYGDPTVSDSFTSDSAWAMNDGASTDYLGAEFFATAVPEPSTFILLGSILGFLGIGILGRRRHTSR